MEGLANVDAAAPARDDVFPEANVEGRDLGSGALAALAFDGSLVIAGESQGYATFWIGEAGQAD